MAKIWKYRILIFIILTYLLTFTGGQLFMNRFLETVMNRNLLIILRILYIPAIIAPFTIALLLRYSEGSGEGVRQFLRTYFQRGVSVFWYIIVILLPFTVHFLASILDSLRGEEFQPPFGNAGIETAVRAIIIFVIAGTGEEMGWRGYLLPELQKKLSSFSASLVVGIVTACWHLPLFLQSGSIHYGHIFWHFLILSVAFSFVYTWIMDNTQAVFLAALFHTAHDIASISFSQRDHLSSFLVYAVLAILIVLRYGKKRFRRLKDENR